MGVHLNFLTQMERPVKAVKMMTAWSPIFFRWSSSGSEAQERKVVTSLAIWDEVAFVPSGYSTRPS